MKFQPRNPEQGHKALIMMLSCLLLTAEFSAVAAQESRGAHEYRADGETTIETVNGLRVITLRENVFVRQDDMELTGDVAVLEYNANNELQQVQLTGGPANFEQLGNAETEPLTGNSETINYYAGDEATVEFIGSARFNQPGTTLACERIRYVIESGATTGQACSGSLTPQTD